MRICASNGHIESRGRFIRNQQFGATNQCHGDHHALPHSPRKFVRVLREPCTRIGNAHLREHLGGQRLRFFHRDILMQENRLADLIPHRMHRAQRRHRFLENHAHQPPPHVIQAIILFAESRHIDHAAGARIRAGCPPPPALP